MKLAKILLLVAIAVLPLVLVSCSGTPFSCSGAAQPTGGWSGPVFHDGMIYVGSKDGRVIAINASSREKEWQWPDTTAIRGLIYTTPIVDGDLVCIGTYSGEVYALNRADGVVKWVHPPKSEGYIGGLVGSPVIADGIIYTSSSDGRVYALNTTSGKPRWVSNRTSDYKLWTSPAVVGDTIYISTFDGRICALSTETGELLDWSFEAEAGFASSPVVYEDHIYVGSFDRRLYSVEIGSNVSTWRFPEEKAAGSWFWASPIVNEGTVYAGCLNGKVYAIDAETGEGLWEFDAGSPIVSSPVLIDNLLIVAAESGNVYVINPETGNGERIRNPDSGDKPTIDAQVRASICAHDSLVYIRDENGKNNQLHAVDTDKEEVSWSLTLTG